MYGAVPETLQGNRPVPSGVPLQGTASSMVIRGVFDGLLGLTPDALVHRMMLEPTIPKRLRRLQLKNIRVGDTLVDLEATSGSRKVRVKSSKPLRVEVALPVKHEEQASGIKAQGATVRKIRMQSSLRGLRAVVSLDLKRGRTATLLVKN